MKTIIDFNGNEVEKQKGKSIYLTHQEYEDIKYLLSIHIQDCLEMNCNEEMEAFQRILIKINKEI